MRKLLFFLLFPCFLSLPAHSNDTAATVTTGGAKFKQSKNVSMESEELAISLDRIHVKYLFRNRSNKNIEDTVVFPLPVSNSVGVGWQGGEEALEGKNTLNFVLKENGKAKPVEIHARKFDIDKADKSVFQIESFYSWQQVFPAEKTIEIEHEYDTHPGSGGNTSFSEVNKAKYCIDDDFLKAFEKLKKKIQEIASKSEREDMKVLGTYMHYHSFSHVSYILKTANNWDGPIKKFKLIIKKDKPSTLVSLCWDGLKKVSDTEFISTKKNFAPASDLNILYVHER